MKPEPSLPVMPGLLLDSENRIAVVVVSDETVGTSFRRLDYVPSLIEALEMLDSERWLVVGRSSGDKLHTVEPHSDLMGCMVALETAEERETAIMAMSVGLKIWPEWCPDIRGQLSPRDIIPLFTEVPES